MVKAPLTKSLPKTVRPSKAVSVTQVYIIVDEVGICNTTSLNIVMLVLATPEVMMEVTEVSLYKVWKTTEVRMRPTEITTFQSQSTLKQRQNRRKWCTRKRRISSPVDCQTYRDRKRDKIFTQPYHYRPESDIKSRQTTILNIFGTLLKPSAQTYCKRRRNGRPREL